MMGVVYGFVERRKEQLQFEFETECETFKDMLIANMRIKQMDDDVINALEFELVREDLD